MEKVNKLIRISGIISVLFALIFIGNFGWYQTCQLIMGIILLSYSTLSIEELTKKKIYIVLSAIISLFFNFIASILLFIVVDDLSGIKSQKINNTALNSETKKIDILLKIGVGMILVSGILIATTSWEALPNIIKCLGLFGLSGIFIGLSKFSEIKLKIHKTTKAYYVVGLSLGWLAFICIGILKVFSNWFSYEGSGADLVWFMTLSLLSGILYLINNKFKEQEYKYMALFVNWISLNFLLSFMGLGREFVGLVITVLLLLFNLLVKNPKFKLLADSSRLVSYVYWPLLLGNYGIDIVIIVTLIIAIINALYLSFEKNDNTNVITIIISYLLSIELMSQIGFGDIHILIFVGISIFYCAVNCSKVKLIKNINQIIYNIIATIIIVFLLDSVLKIFIISIIYGIIHFINYFIINKNNHKFDIYYQPMIILIIVYGIIRILNEFIDINIIYYFIIPTVIYAILEKYILKENHNKKIYYIYLLVLTCLIFMINIIEHDICAGILLIGLATYIFFKNKNYRIWTYIFLLSTIVLFKEVLFVHFSYGILLNFLNILTFGVLCYLLKENSILKKINLISIVIPIYSIIEYIDGIDDIKMVLNNILALYILFIIVTQFITDSKSKDLIATICTSLIVLGIIFNNSLLVGLYIGILGIVIILITYNKKMFKSLFYCGIVITILNILIKVGDFWTKIPLSVYLLLSGAVLIIFVTFKELKSKKQIPSQNEITENTQTINNCQEVKINFCPNCGNKNHGSRYCGKCGIILIKK